jgi:hypothetical protein
MLQVWNVHIGDSMTEGLEEKCAGDGKLRLVFLFKKKRR